MQIATFVVAGDAWPMVGGAAGSLTLAVGVTSATLWVSLTAARLRRTA